MQTTQRIRDAVDAALTDLDAVVAGRRDATPNLIARSLHATLQALAHLLREIEPTEPLVAPASIAAPRPIPPEALADDDDEPTLMFLAGAAIDDDADDDAEDDANDEDATTAASDDDGSAGDDRTFPESDDAADTPSGFGKAPKPQGKVALERFELEDINRWLKTGTPFQLRGDLAYLNLEVSQRLSVDFRTKLSELGYRHELGLLDASALVAPVLLFQS